MGRHKMGAFGARIFRKSARRCSPAAEGGNLSDSRKACVVWSITGALTLGVRFWVFRILKVPWESVLPL